LPERLAAEQPSGPVVVMIGQAFAEYVADATAQQGMPPAVSAAKAL
jgi:hypothetical protein